MGVELLSVADHRDGFAGAPRYDNDAVPTTAGGSGCAHPNS
jgi:hypothetical protein